MNGIGGQRTRVTPRSFCRAHRSSVPAVVRPRLAAPTRVAPVSTPRVVSNRWLGGLVSWALLTLGTYTVLAALVR